MGIGNSTLPSTLRTVSLFTSVSSQGCFKLEFPAFLLCTPFFDLGTFRRGGLLIDENVLRAVIDHWINLKRLKGVGKEPVYCEAVRIMEFPPYFGVYSCTSSASSVTVRPIVKTLSDSVKLIVLYNCCVIYITQLLEVVSVRNPSW